MVGDSEGGAAKSQCNTGVDGDSLPERILILITSQCFCEYEMLQSCKFLVFFARINYT